MSDSHDWITLHRVRFPDPVAALDHDFPPAQGPECWRFCPSHVLGDNNLPTWRSDVWCGFAIHADRASAQAMFDAPDRYFPALAEGVEQWHALAVPVQHRGAVNWRGMVQTDSAIRPSTAEHAGTLAVMTSASFDDPKNPDEIPRISRFAVKVSEAVHFLGQQPGNLRHDVFNGGFDGLEGFTLTLWQSDDAMLRAAYHSGHHRKLMDESRDGSTFDRSSFTRLRIIGSHGSWSGDPLKDAA